MNGCGRQAFFYNTLNEAFLVAGPFLHIVQYKQNVKTVKCNVLLVYKYSKGEIGLMRKSSQKVHPLTEREAWQVQKFRYGFRLAPTARTIRHTQILEKRQGQPHLLFCIELWRPEFPERNTKTGTRADSSLDLPRSSWWICRTDPRCLTADRPWHSPHPTPLSDLLISEWFFTITWDTVESERCGLYKREKNSTLNGRRSLSETQAPLTLLARLIVSDFVYKYSTEETNY